MAVTKLAQMPAESRKILSNFFDKHPEVQFLRIQILDHGAQVRVAVFPKERALDIAVTGSFKGPGIPFISGFTLANSLMLSSVKAGIEDWLPDWSSLRVCGSQPHHATVMAFARQEPINETPPREGLALCPRAQLLSQLQKAGDVKFLVGWEIELLILDKDRSEPGHSSAMSTTALRSPYTAVVEEIVHTLEKAGIRIYKFHPEEAYNGFFEIATLPLPPMEACDALVFCHETIKGIANNRGFHATMFPSPFEASGISIGSHLNLSVSGTPSAADSSNFLAGMLEHLPALQSFMNASYDSYSRSSLFKWAAWGEENKLAPIRQCPRTDHWELRLADASMNPYIALAAVIMAGMHGIRTATPLTLKSLSAVTFDPDEANRAECGISRRLPETFSEALRELEGDQVLKDEEHGFGAAFVEAYLRLKRQENDDLKKMPATKRRELAIRVF